MSLEIFRFNELIITARLAATTGMAAERLTFHAGGASTGRNRFNY
jgi:hypothetical protein